MSDQGFTSQKLNLTLALCAILISIASFYATYLQANAAEKQVKAMTLPLLQFGTGNVNNETKESVLEFSITNNGVGPALLKSSNFRYKEQDYQRFSQFLDACCQVEYKKFKQNKPKAHLKLGSEITSSIHNRILPAQEEHIFYRLYNGELSSELWQKLNDERSHLSVEMCYCSLLDECYLTKARGLVVPIEACPVQ
ncbi:MAG: hypothetical protein HRT50_04745 [Colwellia sp.]|uniref:hypothetical protein n=1 Tax=Colwellia sp. TaxID=56799 RepID=UPI001DBCB9C2|nr:hypothetical protein [Colwellia sp.]NQY48401.1 hypothetical protein [Colwellia sp.]